MLYVILVAAIIIFWLVAVDRPVLVVTFKDGHITKSKGHFPHTFKHNLVDITQHEPFSGQLKVYQQRTGAKLTFTNQVPKKYNNEFVMYFLIKVLHIRIQHSRKVAETHYYTTSSLQQNHSLASNTAKSDKPRGQIQ